VVQLNAPPPWRAGRTPRRLTLIDAILGAAISRTTTWPTRRGRNLCRRLGRTAEARVAYERARQLTQQEPTRFLERVERVGRIERGLRYWRRPYGRQYQGAHDRARSRLLHQRRPIDMLESDRCPTSLVSPAQRVLGSRRESSALGPCVRRSRR